jgi:hypothetical protein
MYNGYHSIYDNKEPGLNVHCTVNGMSVCIITTEGDCYDRITFVIITAAG